MERVRRARRSCGGDRRDARQRGVPRRELGVLGHHLRGHFAVIALVEPDCGAVGTAMGTAPAGMDQLLCPVATAAPMTAMIRLRTTTPAVEPVSYAPHQSTDEWHPLLALLSGIPGDDRLNERVVREPPRNQRRDQPAPEAEAHSPRHIAERDRGGHRHSVTGRRLDGGADRDQNRGNCEDGG